MDGKRTSTIFLSRLANEPNTLSQAHDLPHFSCMKNDWQRPYNKAMGSFWLSILSWNARWPERVWWFGSFVNDDKNDI